jgi:hypothetical protein
MRPIFTLFAGAALLFCSCSSSHKVQNSDDPGYSSGSSRSASSASGQSDYYSTAPSDNYIRMKTTDDARWSQFDDNNSYDNYYASPTALVSPYYAYAYSPYSYGYGMYGMYGFSAMSIGMGFWDPYFGWNSYFMWNMGYNPYFYNPYYGGGVLIVQQPGYYAPGTSPATGVSHVYSNLTAFNASTYRGGALASRTGRSFGNGRSAFASPSNVNSGSGRSFNSNNSRSANTPNYTPRTTGGSGSFGGSQPARSFPSGGSGGGFGGGGSFGGRGGFRH